MAKNKVINKSVFQGKNKNAAAPKGKAQKKEKEIVSDNEEDFLSSSESEEESASSSMEEEPEDDIIQMEGSEEEEEEEEEYDNSEAEEAKAEKKNSENWGNKARNYFKESSESEDESEEEKEAIRLKKEQMADFSQADFKLPEGDDDDDDDDGEEEEEQMNIMKKTKKTSIPPNGDFDDEEADPEVKALLSDFESKVNELNSTVLPLLDRLKSTESATSEGVSFLETKAHLLLSYTTNVTFYLLIRAESGGARAESHPVVKELFRVRILLEKLKPLEKKLEKQIESIMKSAPSTTSSGEHAGDENEEMETQKDVLRFKPNLDDLMDEDEDASGGFHKVEDIGGGEEKSERRSFNKEKKVLDKNKHLLRELQAEFSENPTEVKDAEEDDSKEARFERDKRRYEEENYVRLVETREEKVRNNKKLNRARQGGGVNEILDGFDEEVKAVGSLLKTNKKHVFASVRSEEDVADGGRRKDGINRYVNEFEQGRKSMKQAKVFGGDDEVVYTNKKPNASSSKSTQLEPEETIQPMGLKPLPKQSNPVYDQYAQSKKHSVAEKSKSYQFPERYTPQVARVTLEGGVRKASSQILKNRGLTPHRRKDVKTPRAKLREKFEDKQKARKGQVREVRVGEADRYEGEKTGVRSNLVRSRMVGRI